MSATARWLVALVIAVLTTGGVLGNSSGAEIPDMGKPAVSYPGPGWGAVSPRTGITFQGVDVAELQGLRVTGSMSGPHAGRLHALRVGAGAVFTPDSAFRAGERVTVDAPVQIEGAGGGEFSFAISRPPQLAPKPAAGTAAASRSNGVGRCRARRRRFVTLPSFHPTGFCVTRRRRAKLAPGHLLVTSTPAPVRLPGEQYGAMMVDNAGRLLWYSPHSDRVHDLKTVNYGGRRLLALYRKRPGANGYYEFLDSQYRIVTRLFSGNGYKINAHELQVTPQGTAYVSAYEPVAAPGSGRPVTDFVIQEIDLATRDVLFEWHALDHVPLSATYKPPPSDGTSWDYFHGNSIEAPGADGRTIVISSRNTSALYGIDRLTGSLLWTLGGKRDRFNLVRAHPQWQFCAQHDARRMPNGDVLVFDNGGTALGDRKSCPVHQARVERFRLDTDRMRVRRVASLSSKRVSRNGKGYFPGWVGSARRQRNGDTLVDWGTTGQVTEVAPGGGVKLRLQLGRWSYRAVRAAWTGTPTGRPAVAARRRRGGVVDVWASWNGATRIRRWQVLAGAGPGALAPVGPRFGFADLETRMRVKTRAQYVAVRALDAAGRALGESRAVRG